MKNLFALIPLLALTTFVHADPSSLTTVTTSASGKSLLADTFGRTLYVFDPDQNKPAPACNGGCAEIWPPYLLTPNEVSGLKSPFGFIQRTSQQTQLTVNGRPVYVYAFDRQAGDDLGDGLGKVWHVLQP